MEAAFPEELSGLEVTLTGESVEAMRGSDLALVSSGTAVLEAALLEIPAITFYRLARPTFWTVRILQALGVIRYNRTSIPNLVAARDLIPELLQSEANAARLAEEAARLLLHPELRSEMIRGYREVRALLQAGDSMSKAARILLGSGALPTPKSQTTAAVL